jgi:hypothetical protein
MMMRERGGAPHRSAHPKPTSLPGKKYHKTTTNDDGDDDDDDDDDDGLPKTPRDGAL